MPFLPFYFHLLATPDIVKTLNAKRQNSPTHIIITNSDLKFVLNNIINKIIVSIVVILQIVFTNYVSEKSHSAENKTLSQYSGTR